MKKHLLLFFVVITTTIFQQCTLVNNQPGTAPDQAIAITPSEEGESEEEQDGIREAQEMEFEMTKDVALGYVPKDRLVAAYDNLMQQRKQSPSGVAGIAALTWTERGPNTNSIGPSNGNTRGTQAATDAVTSGRMRAIWVDLDNTNYPNNVWIGSVSGGLWRTTNITSTSPAVWSLVNDFLGNLAISSICQDPTNTDILYFGTGEKTFNGDAVRGGGIWRSTDHGVTWALMPGTSTYYNVSKVVCDAAGNLYVGTIAGAGGTAGVLRYNKVAATWDNISPTGLSARITEMRISTTGRLHVVCGYFNTAAASSGLRYTDNPATVTSGTWTAPTTPIPNTLTPYNVELAVAGSTLYAQCSNSSFLIGGIYKSTDGGVTWAAVTTPPAGTAEPSILPGAQAWYDLAIGCDPNNPNIVIAGGLNFYRSTDGGTTWSQLSRWVGTALQYVHADHHSVVWNTNNTGTGTQVLLATDGGIFYSSDNGASFTDRNDGIRSKQFYSCAIHPTTTNYFIGGTQDNGTHQLTSAGLGASTEVIGGDGGFTHIDEDEPQFQFSAFTGTNFIRSTNGGSNWASVANFGNGQFINPSDYDNGANRMYFSFAGGNYARWDNPQTGTNAFAVNVGAFNARPVLSVQVSPHTANRVFFGTDQGRVVRVDNAHTATPTATDISGSGMNLTTVSCIAVGTNDNNLIATFSNYGSVHVWASTTGGGAGGWTNISGNLPDIPVRWAMFYPENNTKAIVATELGIYETDLINGASTVWVQNTSFPVVKTNMLQYRKSDGLLLAATHGRGLWTAPIPFTNSYVRFATSYITRTEATTATTATCRPYRDYVVNMTIDQAPVGNAT
jgi:trimeric autotransporter adhesin